VIVRFEALTRERARSLQHSDDIDIALDDCLGREFAEKVNEYLAEHGLEHHRIGVIKSNPEQSKHLETATMQVLGVWVDFINLRSEQYAADSRIPSEMVRSYSRCCLANGVQRLIDLICVYISRSALHCKMRSDAT